MKNSTNFAIYLIIGFAVVGLVVLYLATMFRRRRSYEKDVFGSCPQFIRRRYHIWYRSWVYWTVTWYALTITPILTSMLTIYFFASETSGSGNESSFSSLFAFISAFFPLVSAKIKPRLHVDGFYKSLYVLEKAMLSYNAKEISERELVGIWSEIELGTNPLLEQDDANDD